MTISFFTLEKRISPPFSFYTLRNCVELLGHSNTHSSLHTITAPLHISPQLAIHFLQGTGNKKEKKVKAALPPLVRLMHKVKDDTISSLFLDHES